MIIIKCLLLTKEGLSKLERGEDTTIDDCICKEVFFNNIDSISPINIYDKERASINSGSMSFLSEQSFDLIVGNYIKCKRMQLILN